MRQIDSSVMPSPGQPAGLSPADPEEQLTDGVIVDDETLRQGFTLVPNVILRYPGISFGAKLCYAMLLSYAWQKDRCFPGQDRLGADLGVTARSVQTYLAELKQCGIIEVSQRGLTKTNVYRLPRIIGDPRKP